MPRENCLRCQRPTFACLCPDEPPMPTRTRFVLLMHPLEYRHKRCNTGRLTCLNLENSEMIVGLEFDAHPRVRELVDDPANLPVVLYPGKEALDLSAPDFRERLASLGVAPLGKESLASRRLVVFLIDATWDLAKRMVNLNPGLMALRQLRFSPATPSRYRIKRQPASYCLSTLETVHEMLLALEAAGMDRYPDRGRLIAAFDRMQDYQIRMSAERRAPRHRAGTPSASDRSE